MECQMCAQRKLALGNIFEGIDESNVERLRESYSQSHSCDHKNDVTGMQMPSGVLERSSSDLSDADMPSERCQSARQRQRRNAVVSVIDNVAREMSKCNVAEKTSVLGCWYSDWAQTID